MNVQRVVGTLCLLLFCLATKEAKAGKVLVMSMQFGSHLNEFAAVCEGLLKMGHTVHVVMDENKQNPTQFKGMNVEFLYYKSPDKKLVDDKILSERLADAFLVSMMPLMEVMKQIDIPRFTYDCKMTLFNQELVKRLEKEKYDIALADIMIPCYHVLAFRLGLPVVTVSTTQSTWFLKTHPLVSFNQPCGLTKGTNTFANRLKTLFNTYMFERVILPSVFIDTSPFMNYVPGQTYSSLEEVVMRTTKLYINNRNGVIDCPTPSMQNLVSVAGLTTKPAKPLPADYQSYAEKSTHGLIIVSFGSGLATLPKNMFLKFLNAFRSTQLNVIWRIAETYGENIPKNVKIVNWMPQNDLMAHPKVKLFITHSGNNGQLEALYHGVPMLCFPVYADQHYNTDRIIHRGYGLGMDIHKFHTDELIKNIKEITTTNLKYSENIKKASAIHRSLPDPRTTSAFWVDHVMKHGADHLTTVLSDLSFVQFYMIDIFLFISVLLLVILYIVKKLVSYVMSKLVKGQASKTKTN